MNMKKIFVIIILIIAMVIILSTQLYRPKNIDMIETEDRYDITTEDVRYYTNAKGFFAQPTTQEQVPGVIMIHEWWGLNENIKEMAKKLASQGYKVLAVDLYNGEVATEAKKAQELSSRVRENPDEAINNMKAAIAYLKEKQVKNIASLGWCFGGQQSLQITLNDQNIDATIIYYGSLVTDQEQLKKINHPILGVFGAEDTSIPVETVHQFEKALNELNIQNDIVIYDGVGHAFANPSGTNYAQKETEDAWKKTLEFLENNLKNTEK